MFNKLSDVIAYYQKYHLTRHKYQFRRNNLAYFDKYDLKSIRKHHVKEYAVMRRATVSNATINREIAFARASINRVILDYDIKLNNPFKSVKFVESDYMPNYLTRQQYEHLIATAKSTGNDTIHDFIVLLTMTGCRPTELYTLEWSNVYLHKRQFIVRNYYSKNKRTMYKYLNQTAYDVLKNRPREGAYVFTSPVTGGRYTTMTKTFARLKKLAGVECRMYDLRHTYASWLVQAGVGIYTVKDLLGHSDIESTMRYAHLDYDRLVDAVSLIE